VKDVKEVYKRVVQKLPSIIDGNKKEDIVKEEVEGRLLLKDNLLYCIGHHPLNK
jgi:hypothetical protein